jgi:hypothetical protein
MGERLDEVERMWVQGNRIARFDSPHGCGADTYPLPNPPGRRQNEAEEAGGETDLVKIKARVSKADVTNWPASAFQR